jgi:hypothetical protein
MVNSEDEETTSSTLGSSIRGSVIDLLSDTSSEPSQGDQDSQWEDDLHDQHDLSGSYADAEATATELSDSKTTLASSQTYPYGLDSTASSQIRLIMPDPTASFSSSSGTETTPSASLGNLLSLPALPRRGSGIGGTVDRSWLEASSRLWNVSPEMESLVIEADVVSYKVLQSMENIKQDEGKEEKEVLLPANPLNGTVEADIEGGEQEKKQKPAQLKGLPIGSVHWYVSPVLHAHH